MSSATRYRTAPAPITGIPPGIPYIVGNEAAERYSYYGMRAILVIFMTKFLMNAQGDLDPMTDEQAKTWFHVFVTAVYFFPLFGAIIADVFVGKYRTIIALSIVYCLGHLTLAIDDTRIGLAIGLGLIAVGSGGIKPCVSAHVGDQFGQTNAPLLPKVFGWFYFAINVGALASILFAEPLLHRFGSSVAFGVPGVLMAIATFVFWMGRKKFVHIPPGGVAFLREVFSGEGLAALGKLFIIYTFIAMFWALFDQQGSAWVLQAARMDRHFIVDWDPSQAQWLNPALVLLFIPLFNRVIYPAFDRFWPLTPLKRISIGLFLTVPAFLLPAWLEARLDAGETINIVWQLGGYVIMTAAEILVSITALEFSYTQSPKRMKSLVMGAFLMSVSVGNLFTAAVNFFIQNPDGTSKLDGASYYLFFAATMALTAILFVPVAVWYKERTYIQDETPRGGSVNIIDRARSWVAHDPDPETRRELEALIDSGDVAALEERFAGTLQFGTAGLRGLLGAGPTRMNRVMVARATAGLCAWLKQEVPEVTSRGICVGRDARLHSDVFERDVIEVAAGAGIPVWTFSDVVPTPVLAYAVLELRAAGGVMITASHNPPGYNGYKVYWENGAQIIPPNDRGIAGEIERAPTIDPIPRVSVEEARANQWLREVDSVRGDYIERIAAEVSLSEPRADVRVAYTALHGVAEDTFRKVMTRAGFEDVHSVSEQAAPDGRFPTVAFPNPEEAGAMDRVLALAERVNADLAIANDPDGDRLGVAVRGEGAFTLLSGNDVGVLLADDLLRRHRESAKPLVISTVVSSPILGPVAASHGARWEQTLTGHKWIQNLALELEQEGFTYVFGYEEALGYAPSRAVRDKDGISSALLIADMAARLKAGGQTLLDAREGLWRKHGFFADRQISVRFEGPAAHARMRTVVDRYREEPPPQIGGRPVLRMLDLERQVQWTPAGVTPHTNLAPSNLLIFELEGGHQAMVRPSGTESKLKYYFYATDPTHAREDLAASKKRAFDVLERMVQDLT